jgi:hypothetical protein
MLNRFLSLIRIYLKKDKKQKKTLKMRQLSTPLHQAVFTHTQSHTYYGGVLWSIHTRLR